MSRLCGSFGKSASTRCILQEQQRLFGNPIGKMPLKLKAEKNRGLYEKQNDL
jgi:hypothetical protein